MERTNGGTEAQKRRTYYSTRESIHHNPGLGVVRAACGVQRYATFVSGVFDVIFDFLGHHDC